MKSLPRRSPRLPAPAEGMFSVAVPPRDTGEAVQLMSVPVDPVENEIEELVSPEFPSVPEIVGVVVSVFPEPTVCTPNVSPLKVAVEEARVTTPLVTSCPRGPIAVRDPIPRPRELVAVKVYPPEEFPTSSCPYVGADVSPVPPYSTPMEEVAETTPLFACRGPLRFARVSPPLKVFKAEKVFVVVVAKAVLNTPEEEL